MKLSKDQLIGLSTVAKQTAQAAAEFITTARTQSIPVTHKDDMDSEASAVVTWVDLACQNLILAALKESIEIYDLGLLTEEAEDDQSRFDKDYFWCIDPIDGTLAFTEDRFGYAISIALVSREGIPVLGVVNDPVKNIVYSSHIHDNTAIFEPQEDPEGEDTLVCCIDSGFRYHPRYSEVLKQLTMIKQSMQLSHLRIITGLGAVLNACEVMRHKHALYFKLPKKKKGGGCIWDYAATSLFFTKLGKPVSDIDGNKLALNEKNIFMNDCGIIYASDRTLSECMSNIYHGFIA